MNESIEKPKPRRNRCPHCGKFIKRPEGQGSNATLVIFGIVCGMAAGYALGLFIGCGIGAKFIDRLI